jgi:uncharacterized lipoprotein YajG
LRKLIILAAAFILLTGCGKMNTIIPSTTSDKFTEVSRDTTNLVDVQIIKDKETGCHYIVNSSHTNSAGIGAIYPRMGADGKQICK